MVNVILQLYPQIPGTREERIEKRPLGRDAQRCCALRRLQDDRVVRGLAQQRREAIAEHRMIVHHQQLHELTICQRHRVRQVPARCARCRRRT